MLNFSGDTEPRSIIWRNLTQFDIDRRQFNLAFLPSRLSSLLLLLNLLTACSSQSSTDKLAKELQTVKSWTATAHMVADAQIHGDVPTAYAKHTLEKAQEGIATVGSVIVLLSSPGALAFVLAIVAIPLEVLGG